MAGIDGHNRCWYKDGWLVVVVVVVQAKERKREKRIKIK
jgi:hypothetical protein